MKKTILTFILGVIGITSFGQNLTFYGLLPVINQTGRINKKFNYNLFVSTTIDAFDSKWNNVEYKPTDLQFYFQPSIIYVHSPKFNIAASYTYQRNNPFNNTAAVNPSSSAFNNEHRLWQQAIFSFPVSKGRLTNRFRFEERFIQQKDNGYAVPNDYHLFTRLRYQLAFNMPLQGKTLDEKEFYLSAYNEFYFSLTGPKNVTGAKNATYNENWSYIGTGYNFGKKGRLELGYLMQTFVRNANKDLRILQLAQVMWVTNFDFFKKKEQKK